MKYSLICVILILNTSIASASSWIDYTDIPETRKHIQEDNLTIIHACKNKESYDKIKNFSAIEYIVKACAVSKKFPIGSAEKRLCNYISKENLERTELACSKRGVEQKYSEEDLAPYYKNFLTQSPNCNHQYSCFEMFMNQFSIDHADEFDCKSKFKLSYDLICEIENKYSA